MENKETTARDIYRKVKYGRLEITQPPVILVHKHLYALTALRVTRLYAA